MRLNDKAGRRSRSRLLPILAVACALCSGLHLYALTESAAGLAVDGKDPDAAMPGFPAAIAPGTPEWFASPRGWASDEYSEVEARLYRMDIHPVQPNDGILTGYVVAYGHLLARPYRFENRGDSVLSVNGIQVYPELRNPRYDSASVRFWAAARPSRPSWSRADLDSAHRVRDSLYALAARIAAGRPQTGGAIRDSIWLVLRSFAFVDTSMCGVEVYERDGWAYEANVLYGMLVVRDGRTIALTPASPILRLQPGRTPDCAIGWSASDPDSLSAVAIRLGSAQSSLGRGRLLIFGAHGGGSYPASLLRRLRETLRADNAEWAKAAEILLAGGLLTAPPAKEVMYNYHDSEYDWLRWEK